MLLSPTTSKEIVLSFILATCVGIVVYFRTLNPAVAGGDSGELMVVAMELGTPHPPGYPTFAMLSKAAVSFGSALLPPSVHVSPSVLMNGFHALLSSLALGIIASSVVLAGGTLASGLAAAGMFGFAPNVWTYAVSTEVFPLNNVFSALIIFCAIYFDKLLTVSTCEKMKGTGIAGGGERGSEERRRDEAERKIDWFVTFSSFIYGLALTNQHTSVLYVVPLVLWVFARRPSTWRRCTLLLRNSAAFFIGLSPNAYLPLSNYFVRTPLSWGRSFTLDGFMTHFFRKEYGTFSLASQEATYRNTNSIFARNTEKYFLDIVDQLGPWAAGVCLMSFVVVTGLTTWELLGHFMLRQQKISNKGAAVAAASRKSAQPKTSKSPSQKLEKGPTNASMENSNSVINSETSTDWSVLLFPQSLFYLIVTWLAYITFFNYLSNLPIEKPLFYGVQQRFWIQPLIIIMVVSGSVVGSVTKRWLWHSDGRKGGRTLSGFAFAELAVAIAIVGAQIQTHFDTQDESGNWHIAHHGASVLRPLPPNSVLFTLGDIHANSVRYAQVFHGVKKDDVLVMDLEMLTFPWYVSNYKDYLEGRKERHTATSLDKPYANETSFKFLDFKFPGVRYYPDTENGFSLLQLIQTNAQKGRRFFIVGGLKEGDDYSTSLLLRRFGRVEEILTSKVSGSPILIKSRMNTRGKMGEDIESQEALRALTDKDDIIETIFSLEAAGSAPIPSPSRYRNHTWEFSVGQDAKNAYHGTGHMLLSAAQRFMADDSKGFRERRTKDNSASTLPTLEKLLAPRLKECQTSFIPHQSFFSHGNSHISTVSASLAPQHVLPSMHVLQNKTLVHLLPSRLVALLGAYSHFRTAIDCYNAYDSLRYESVRNAVVTLQEIMSYAEKENDFAKSMMVPHLQSLLTDFPEHPTLSHDTIRTIIRNLESH